MSLKRISVIGAGVAGCAAAISAAARGADVLLYEQRPLRSTPVHTTGIPGELCGGGDFGAEETDRAGGLLNAELRELVPSLSSCIDAARMGEHTLLVAREAFSQAVRDLVEASPRIELREEHVAALPDGPVVIASGPATWSPLARASHAAAGAPVVFSYCGRPPLIAADSVDLSEALFVPPYPGAEPTIFLPLSDDEVAGLARLIASGARDHPAGLEPQMVLADEQVPVERLAADADELASTILRGPRGPQVQTEGPALCLVPDDPEQSAFHLQGLCTSLTTAAQQSALAAVAALSEVRVLRPGLIHRTPWLAGREATLSSLELERLSRVLLAGTLTGAWGYLEAMATGAVAGVGAASLADGRSPLPPPPDSMTGALCYAIARREPQGDSRMLRANFGMLPERPQDEGMSKTERRRGQIERALNAMREYAGR